MNFDCENVDISDPETDCRAFHRIGDRFVKDTVPEREEDRKGKSKELLPRVECLWHGLTNLSHNCAGNQTKFVKNELYMERFHGNRLKNMNSAVILKITPPKKKFGARGWHKESKGFPENLSSLSRPSHTPYIVLGKRSHGRGGIIAGIL